MTAPDPNPPPDPSPAGGLGSQSAYQKVRLSFAADHSAAILFIGSGASPESVNPMAITALVEERGIARTPELAAAIKSTVDEHLRNPTVDVERIVAQGTPPVHGIDGRLELDPRFDPEKRATATVEPQPSGSTRVDHHARTKYVSAHAGDVLGRVIPPVIGREGIDIFGRALNPREARALKLLTDETIHVAPDGTITATANGMLVRSGNTLRISRRLDIPESVDFSTGNIDFPGDVIVNRGVRDCFSVHAGRTLLIRGLVEAADLRADLDITLEGGMAGRQKGSLHARRDVTALYLEQVNGRIGRDLLLGKEATHVHLSVGHAIIGTNAALIGGDVCVAGRAELAQVGSDAGAATKLAIGHLPEIDQQLKATVEMLERIIAKRDAATTKLKQLQAAATKLTAQQAEELTEREFEVATLEQQRKKLAAALVKLLELLDGAGEPSLTVHTEVWQGVRLWIGKFVCEPRHTIRGPLKIFLNEHGEPQLLLKTSGATSALSTVCRVMHDERFADRAAVCTLAGHKPVRAFSDEGSTPKAAAA